MSTGRLDAVNPITERPSTSTWTRHQFDIGLTGNPEDFAHIGDDAGKHRNLAARVNVLPIRSDRLARNVLQRAGERA